MITISKYYLANIKDKNEFDKIRKEVLFILRKSYEPIYFGDEIYNEKFDRNNLTVLVASKGGIPVGVLIKKAEGKLSALAVISRFRRCGIATRLLHELQKGNEYLFGEVCFENKVMRRLMKRLKFSLVRDFTHLVRILASNNTKTDQNGSNYNLELDPHTRLLVYEFCPQVKIPHSKLNRKKRLRLKALS